MRFYKLIYIFVLQSGFAYLSEAQIAVKGKVVAMDGNPIPYANITFRNFGTCSNDMGLFGLNISGVNKTIVIKISCVGYETKEVAVNQISPSIDLGTVTLNVKIMTLDEVMVKAKMTTVEETLEKIYKNLGKNFSEKPFQRQVLARVNKFDQARKLLQVVNVAFDEYCPKGYTKNLKRTINLTHGHSAGEGKYASVDGEELFWIDLFFLRRHDAYLYSHPYTSRKGYSYQIDNNFYEYDGMSAIAIAYTLLNPSDGKNGGWPNATKLTGKIYINETDYAIVRIEETILLRDYNPKDKSTQEKKFNKAIQFKQLTNTVNFKKSNGYYYLSDSHVERKNGNSDDDWAVVKSDLIVTEYKPFQVECNPCNIDFSKTIQGAKFWQNQPSLID